jgi:hypothetical protein
VKYCKKASGFDELLVAAEGLAQLEYINMAKPMSPTPA